MANSNVDQEQGDLEILWRKNICPFCGKLIPEGTRIGDGVKGHGGFCSLDCYARYYEQELVVRALRLAELSQKVKA